MRLKDKVKRLQRKVFDPNRAGTDAVHPVTILSALKTQAEAGKKIFKQSTMVPDRYTVCLANKDLADLKPLMTVMVAELKEELAAYITGKGYRTIRPDVEVQFEVEEKLMPGKISVTACFGSGDNVQVDQQPNAETRLSGEKTFKVRLVLQVDDRPDEEKTFSPGSYVIGRGNEADIMLSFPDPLVSKQHCRLEIGKEGCKVMDLNSVNGTYLNGHRITQPETIQEGEELIIGNTRIKLMVP